MSTYFTYMAVLLALFGIGVVVGAIASRRLSLTGRRVGLVACATALVLIAVLDTPKHPWFAVLAAFLLANAILDLRRARVATVKPEQPAVGGE